MKSKMMLALVAAGLLGCGMTVKAEEAAATTTTGTTTATATTETAATTATAPAALSKKDAAFLKKLKKTHPDAYAKYEEAVKADPTSAAQVLSDLKAKYASKKKSSKK